MVTEVQEATWKDELCGFLVPAHVYVFDRHPASVAAKPALLKGRGAQLLQRAPQRIPRHLGQSRHERRSQTTHSNTSHVTDYCVLRGTQILYIMDCSGKCVHPKILYIGRVNLNTIIDQEIT